MSTVRPGEPIRCCVCFERIDQNASICPHCHSYQREWKNVARYYASVVGLVSFVVAAMVYVGEKAIQSYTWMTWEDRIQILAFETMESAMVKNTGDGQIVISTLSVRSTNPEYEEFIAANKVLNRGETAEIDTGKARKEKDVFLKYVRGVSDSQWNEMLDVGRSGFIPKYFFSQSPEARKLSENNGARYFDCEIEIRYLSARLEGEQKMTFKGEECCRGFLMERVPMAQFPANPDVL